MVAYAADCLSSIVTIAMRHSAVSRQTPARLNGPEVKVLDCVT